MSDINDRRRREGRDGGRERDRWERTDDRLYDQGWRAREVRLTEERIRDAFARNPERGSAPRDEMSRLERIRERSPARRMRDFDPRREAAAEDVEIRTDARGFLRRHAGESLDAATERAVWKALERRRAERDRGGWG